MADQNQEPGEGTNYEVVVPALVALRLCTDPDVLDFEIQINTNPCRNKTSKFDDITLKIELKNSETLYFAIQLKHGKRDDKSIKEESFEKGKEAQQPKGDFLLNMYCQSSFCDKVIGCLHPKSNCQAPNACGIIHCKIGAACKLPHRKVETVVWKRNEIRYILYTNKGFVPKKKVAKDKFQFEITPFPDCNGKKYFQTGGEVYNFQTNEHTKETEHVWKEDYEMFFENFSLYVNQKNAKDVEKEVVSTFETQFGSRQQAVHYINFFRHCHANTYSDKTIDKEMVRIQLLELLLPQEKLAFTPTMKFFEEITKTVSITVIDEDYESVCLNYCTKNWEDTIFTIKTNKEQGQRKKIIEKDVSCVNTKSMVSMLHYIYEYPIIIRYENNKTLEKVINLFGSNNLHFVLIGKNISNTFSTKVFRNLKDQKLSDDIYNDLKIGLRKGQFILLKDLIAPDNEPLLEYISVANMLQMFTKRYHLPETTHFNEDYFPRQVKSNIRDCDISKNFNTENYLLSGDAGCGKTELFKYLSTTWPLETYTVYVNLREKQCTPESCLDVFLDIDPTNFLKNKLKEILKNKGQIIFFFDALDEVADKSQTIECLKQIQEKKIKFWVAARISFQNDLQQALTTVHCLELEEFPVDTQDSYIAWKMERMIGIDQTTIGATVEKIRQIRKTRQENEHLIARPFYLDMLINIYVKDDQESLELRDKFVVTDMFRLFTAGNFTHYLQKQDLIRTDFAAFDFLKYYFWEQYEKTAMKSCFGSILTTSDSDSSCYQIFLTHIENRKEDPLGIVSTNIDGSIEFNHRNYAEYFAALYISKNFLYLNNLKDVIGGVQNTNIRYFLDLELTKRHPLFLAVLYRNLQEIEDNFEQTNIIKDSSNRNVLHLACSQMPDPEGHEVLEKILKKITNLKKFNQRDGLHKLTPVEYCQFFKYPTYSALLRKYNFELTEDMIHNILDYATSENSPSHLQELIEDRHNRELQLQIQNYLTANEDILLKSVCRNYFEIVRLLLPTGLEFQDNLGKTPLYYAITGGLDKIFVSIITAGAEINLFQNNFSPLQLTVAHEKLDICTYLVRTCGISINDKKNGFAALHIAILHHRTNVLEFLVNDLEADVDVSCQFERNPLEIDCIAREILGPIWDQIESYEPRSALDLAIDCEYSDCAEFLRQKNARTIKNR